MFTYTDLRTQNADITQISSVKYLLLSTLSAVAAAPHDLSQSQTQGNPALITRENLHPRAEATWTIRARIGTGTGSWETFEGGPKTCIVFPTYVDEIEIKVHSGGCRFGMSPDSCTIDTDNPAYIGYVEIAAGGTWGMKFPDPAYTPPRNVDVSCE